MDILLCILLNFPLYYYLSLYLCYGNYPFSNTLLYVLKFKPI